MQSLYYYIIMDILKERIVFMGTPSFAAHVLEGLINEGYNIVLVVSQKDKEVGRKRILSPSPVKEMALKYNLPVFTPEKIRNDYEEILKYEPSLIITSAYGQIIPKALLDYPKYKCINTHASLLPKYRGGAPIQWAIRNGEEKTGMSIMYMNEKMDEGDILYQKELEIDINDTNKLLFDKLSDLALEMLLELLPKLFNNDLHPIIQDHSLATYAYNLKKEDEFINFNRKTIEVYNHIRSLLDNPGAYSILEGKKYKWLKVSYELNDNCNPNIFKGLEKDYLRIDCLDGFIKIYELKPEGKNTMDAKSFYNGQGRNLINKKFIEELC